MRNLKVLLITVGMVFGGIQSAVAHAELVKSFSCYLFHKDINYYMLQIFYYN
jgi:hypothetical protein